MVAARNLSSTLFAQNTLNTLFLSWCLRTSAKEKDSCPCVFLSTSHGSFLILRHFLSTLLNPLLRHAFLVWHCRNVLPVCSDNPACPLPFLPHVAWPNVVSRSYVFVFFTTSLLCLSPENQGIFSSLALLKGSSEEKYFITLCYFFPECVYFSSFLCFPKPHWSLELKGFQFGSTCFIIKKEGNKRLFLNTTKITQLLLGTVFSPFCCCNRCLLTHGFLEYIVSRGS